MTDDGVVADLEVLAEVARSPTSCSNGLEQAGVPDDDKLVCWSLGSAAR